MFRCLLWGVIAVFRPKLLLIADDLCLRRQLLVLRRRNPPPRFKDPDRRFWILACRWLLDWRSSLPIVKPETVLRWHHRGWRTYCRCRPMCGGVVGRCPIAPGLQTLIRRMASDNRLWGRWRIQAARSTPSMLRSATSTRSPEWDNQTLQGQRAPLRLSQSGLLIL
jgi:hypothetical protein